MRGRRGARALLLLLLVVVVLASGGCRDDTVRIAFRPAAGATYSYVVEVQSETVLRLPGREPRRSQDRFVLEAEHRVLSAGAEGSRVQVQLRSPGGGVRSYEVRLDRAAQLAEVQRVEGLPAEVLGNLGLSEIFPAAAGAPPDEPLAPGARWSVDEPVELPGLAPTRLQGAGRLVALGVVAGRQVATVDSEFSLPVRRSTEADEGRFVLDGHQTTTSRASHALSDGAVEEVSAVTSGRFRLTLLPPEGTVGPPLPGTLEVEVRSKTRRA